MGIYRLTAHVLLLVDAGAVAVALLHGLLVVEEAAGERLARLAHNARDALSAREHHLELLEAAAHGLGEEEEDDGDDDGGDDEEDQVVLPADGLDRDGGSHVDDKVWGWLVGRS